MGTRRNFLRTGLAGAGGLVLAGSASQLLAACGGDDSGGADTTAGGATTTAGSAATTAGGAATTAAGGGSAPGGDAAWEAVVAAAKEEGEVQVYGAGAPATFQALKDAIKKEYGITVNVLEATTAQVTQRVDAEKQAGQNGADVVTQTDSVFQKARTAEGYFVPLTGPDALSPAIAAQRGPEDKYVISNLAPYGYAWNTNAISGDLAFEDILDPKYEGRIGLLDYTTGTTLVALLTLAGAQFDEEYGIPDALQQLAALKPKFYPGQVQQLQDLGAGEIDIALQATAVAVPANAPIKVAYATQSRAVPIYSNVTSWAVHPNAAQVYVNFLVTPAGQEIVASGSVSVLPDISTAVLSADQIHLVNTSEYTEADFTEQQAALKAIFGR